MSDKNNENTTSTSYAAGYIAYQPHEQDGQSECYTRIGASQAHADGAGFDIEFDEPASDGRVFLRFPQAARE